MSFADVTPVITRQFVAHWTLPRRPLGGGCSHKACGPLRLGTHVDLSPHDAPVPRSAGGRGQTTSSLCPAVIAAIRLKSNCQLHLGRPESPFHGGGAMLASGTWQHPPSPSGAALVPSGSTARSPPPCQVGLVLRTIMLLSTVLLAVGSLAAVIEPPRPANYRHAAAPPQLDWVRTADGWERPARWQPPAAVVPPLHPFVVAGLLAMLAISGLVALPPVPGTNKS